MGRIRYIREQKVILDRDLAEMYKVTTGNLNKAVSRNLNRFPVDFMFRLTKDEYENLKFQNGISRMTAGKANWGGTRRLPYAFTEQGVAMLSSVLKSDTAIEVNIRIVRIFVKLREMLLTHKDILIKLDQLEKQVIANSEDIGNIFSALRELINPPQKPRTVIGFKLAGRKKK